MFSVLNQLPHFQKNMVGEEDKEEKVLDRAWVPNGKQRDKVKLLYKEIQSEHMYNFCH